MLTSTGHTGPEEKANGVRMEPHIEDETCWRRHPRVLSGKAPSRVEIGRWRQRCYDGAHELRAHPTNEHYTIDVLLGVTRVDCFKDGRKISSGRAAFGATQIAAPGQTIRCRFERASEAVHVFVPNSRVVAAYEEIHQQSRPVGFELGDPCFRTDITMGKLAQALLEADTLSGPFAALYCDSIVMAMLTRLIGMQKCHAADTMMHQGLVGWRLRRAMDFIEANMKVPITLEEIAHEAGLSRMHFAAQFRLATGLSPHRFLVHCRVEKAKELLADPSLPIVQIALELGFSSQAHFTGVFRSSTGTTPALWRNSCSRKSIRGTSFT